MTFYAILGIPPDADEETIRIAYRALARRYHPDVGEGSSPERFREVVDAYETLSDPQRRRTYDLELGHRHSHTAPIEPLTPSEPLRSTEQVYVAEYLDSYLDSVFDEFLSSLDDDLFFFGRHKR